MIFKRKMADRPYRVPATLVQRFGGFLLDGGLFVFALIGLGIAFQTLYKIPPARLQEIIPDTKNAWTHVWLMSGLSAFALLLMALFLVSPWRASPGMQNFFIQATRMSGERIGFFRGILWTLTGLTPLLIAYFLVTIGLALKVPIMHIGLLNLFSLMLLLQSVIFAPILMRKDRRSGPDILFDIRVDYLARRPEGLHPIKKLFHLPFLIVFVFAMISSSTVAAINLFDMPLSNKIAVYDDLKSKKFNILRETWRDEASFEVSIQLADFRCASQIHRFHPSSVCPTHTEIETFVRDHQELVDAYRKSIDVIQSDTGRLHDIYLNSESVALTDLMLADLILRFEATKDITALEELFKIQKFWRGAATKPGYMINQTRALIHYAHTLLTLPVFLAHAPDLIDTHRTEIEDSLSALIFDDAFLDGIMAYEYGLYDEQLRFALIDFFPFMQPNQTRNAFVEASTALSMFFDERLLAEDSPERTALQQTLDHQYQWYDLYNPLGTRLRDYALKSLQMSGYAISSYHHTNALKHALSLYIDALSDGHNLDTFAVYFKALSDDKKRVLYSVPLTWEENTKTLYYAPPVLGGFRRDIQL